MTKYPFQQHNHETLDTANAQLLDLGRHADVTMLQLTVVLKEVVYQRRPRLTLRRP